MHKEFLQHRYCFESLQDLCLCTFFCAENTQSLVATFSPEAMLIQSLQSCNLLLPCTVLICIYSFLQNQTGITHLQQGVRDLHLLQIAAWQLQR